MPDDLTLQRIRVPREDRSLLSIPGLETTRQLVEENRQLFAEASCSLHGRNLKDLRAAARQVAVKLARDFTSSLIQADVPQASAESLVISGHQPELFHVGVWTKNFTLAGVAKSAQATAVNLIIDNDTLNHTSIRIPAGTRETMHFDHVLFDTPRPTQPWEEGLLRDRDLFRQFGSTVQQRMRHAWGIESLIGTSWPAGLAQTAVSDRLCDALTAVRVQTERAWGLRNLELPMSRLCESEPFLWFVSHLLTRLPELHAAYNKTVGEYRRSHQLRNRQQPVPDLAIVGDWLEAPFWIWQRGDFQRGRLFARRIGDFCELRDEKEVFARFPWTDIGSLDSAVQVLSELPGRGYRLRTRALTTTLFARTCLADLFVHGIGGAKYDAMTDQLCHQLFGFTAPKFLTVSATLYLPLGGPFPVAEPQWQAINQELRDLSYNPDRHLAHQSDTASLVATKKAVLQSANSLRAAGQLKGKLTAAQHRQLADVRSHLHSQAQQVRSKYEAQRTSLRNELAANKVIRNREFAFVLYPEAQVRDFLSPLSR